MRYIGRMILGIGVDLIEIARVGRLLEKYPQRFRERCFTPAERAYCDARKQFAQHYAARYAVKEAAFKAIGTGLRGVSWQDAEVTRDPGQAPELTYTGKAFIRFSDMGCTHAYVSISHSRDFAIAQVVVERRTIARG